MIGDLIIEQPDLIADEATPAMVDLVLIDGRINELTKRLMVPWGVPEVTFDIERSGVLTFMRLYLAGVEFGHWRFMRSKPVNFGDRVLVFDIGWGQHVR